MNICPDCGVILEVFNEEDKFYGCRCGCLTISGWLTEQAAIQAWWKVIKLMSDITIYGTSPLLFNSE